MEKIRLSARELLITIPEMKHLFKYLEEKSIEYNKILHFLNEVKHRDRKGNLKTSLVIQRELGITPNKFKKNLDQIYYDLLDTISIEDEKFVVGSIDCYLLCSSFGRHYSFHCHLPFIPEVGDSVRIPFLYPIFSIYYFFVLRVDHTLSAENQTIDIWLTTGYFNRFARLEYDRHIYQNKTHESQKIEREQYNILAGF
ncbi:hypothetical protein ACFLRG_00590 [Bacteroidota bacterium]